VSSRIELSLAPSFIAGSLAVIPWLLLAAFNIGAALESSLWLLSGLPAIGWLGWQSFKKHGLLSGPSAIIALEAENTGVKCRRRDGRKVQCRIGSSSSLGASVLVLNLLPEGTRFTPIIVVMTGDVGPFKARVPEPDFRRLRMMLRIGLPSGTP